MRNESAKGRSDRWRACWRAGRRAVGLGLITMSAGLLAGSPAAAQQGAASLRGTVADSAGAGIAGAVIHLGGTRLGALVDSAGRYEVDGVPGGTYTVIVRAAGFAAESAVVALAPDVRAMHDFVLRRALTRLSAVVVTASPRLNETVAQALEKQRNADNIVSVMSGDEIRALPNANAAEAAARIPGVSTERDEGEGKFVQIRGTEPRLSNVTIDGAHVPGTEQGDRIPKLDAVPSDLLAAITVSKTLTADMDADAIGGSVNLVTKTPEGPPRGYMSGQFGAMSLQSRTQGQGSLMYGGRFGPDDRLGLLLGGTVDRNNRAINDVEPAWAVDGSGRSYPVEWDQRDYLYDRTRYGVGGDADYRFADGGTLFLKGLWSLFHNYGNTYRFDVATAGDSSQAASATGGIGTGATFVRQTSNRTPAEQMYGFTAGGRKPLGRVHLDFALNLAGTRQSIQNYRFNSFEFDGAGGNGVPLAYTTSRTAPGYRFLSATDSAAAYDPANYQLTGYSLSDGLTTGRDLGGEVNALLHYAWGEHQGGFKWGAKLRDETKDYVSRRGSFSPVTTYLLSQALSGFSDPGFYTALAGGYHIGPEPSQGMVTSFENANPADFANRTDSVGDLLSSFSGAERVYAAYVMNTIDVGALRVNAGLRVERTDERYTGHVGTTPVDSAGNATGPTTVTTVPGTQTYTDLFPSLQLRYAVTPATNVRFAVTRAIARPNYGDIAPHLSGTLCATCQYQFGNLSAGNPNLKPQHAWNVDLLAEHYMGRTGVLSAGFFYKRITGFIYDREFVYAGPVAEFRGYYGIQPANGGTGHVTGAEFDYSQRLASLPGALAGLGFDVNWTHTESSAQLLSDTASTAAGLGHPVARTVKLPRQSPDIANVALTYDRGRWSARAAWQYQGANITSYGDGTSTANGDTYFYAHSQIDASVIITLLGDTQLQLQGLDLNNAVFGFFNGTPGTRYGIQREYYGRTFLVGLKYGFGAPSPGA